MLCCRKSRIRGVICHPKGYLAGAAISGGCSSIEWFREKIAQNAPYEQLECREDVDTPVFLPFLYGERCPGENKEAKRRFLRAEAVP